MNEFLPSGSRMEWNGKSRQKECREERRGMNTFPLVPGHRPISHLWQIGGISAIFVFLRLLFLSFFFFLVLPSFPSLIHLITEIIALAVFCFCRRAQPVTKMNECIGITAQLCLCRRLESEFGYSIMQLGKWIKFFTRPNLIQSFSAFEKDFSITHPIFAHSMNFPWFILWSSSVLVHHCS